MKLRKFLQETTLFSLATAINKGILLLSLPIVGQVLSVSHFGLWSISQITVFFFSILFSFNGHAPIVRFGLKNHAKSKALTSKFLKINIVFLIITIASVNLFSGWFFWALLLSSIEGIKILLLGYSRALEKNRIFIIISTFKIIAIIFATLIYSGNGVEELLFYQSCIEGVLVMLSCIIILGLPKSSIKLKWKYDQNLKFALSLIPHSFSLWVIASSDRYIVKYLLGDEQLGFYSTIYALSQALMLINSGIAVTMPNFVFSGFKKYINGDTRKKLIVLYTILSLFVYMILVLSINMFKDNIEVLSFFTFNSFQQLQLIFLGIFCLGLYYFYSVILIYLKKGRQVSIITMSASVLTITLSYVLTTEYSLTGTSLATLLTYLIYLILIFVAARIHVNRIKKDAFLLIACLCLMVFSTTIINILFI